jgi:hypothetical protein
MFTKEQFSLALVELIKAVFLNFTLFGHPFSPRLTLIPVRTSQNRPIFLKRNLDCSHINHRAGTIFNGGYLKYAGYKP